MKLVIVESPTKARKLTHFLGSGYQVESSVGHIVDLPKSGINIDFEHDFAPKYEVMPDKKQVVAKLRKLADRAEVIYLASDPDREGEAIAWHLKEVLSEPAKPKKERNFKRATFHEITEEAVKAAIAHPGEINLDLVNAQQARRVLDRIVGYQVSPVLWRKIRRGLSAGRVQSVALRLIVEREKEIAAFVPDEYWELGVVVHESPGQKRISKLKEVLKNNDLPEGAVFASVTKAQGKKYEPQTKDDVVGVVKDLQAAVYKVTKVDQKERKTSSYPPFTTSTLQQAAATRLGMTSKQTMNIAQQLYEEGLITYHRTDSFNLSTKAVAAARGYIAKTFGEQYLPEKARIFARKSKNAQEAHEAIRVTDVTMRQLPAGISPKFTAAHAKLYDLIWRRFVACQMAAAVYDQTAVTIEAVHQGRDYELKASGSVKKFDGWTKLFAQSEDRIIPKLQADQVVYFGQELAEQKFTQPPARYNDASIIKKLEELGIGRPSTYASIISVIIDRGYVERQQKKFFATLVGMTVSDFLMKNLHQFVEYDFTADLETKLDEIASGQKEWTKVLHDFYGPWQTEMTKVEGAERVQVPVEKTGEKCPLCGEKEGGEIVIRQGKYGKFKSCSRFPECKFTQNLVEKLEGQHCPLCGQGDVVLKPSRWGKKFYGCSRYPECGWASWSKPAPDLVITSEQWAQMQAEREERKAKRAAAQAAKKGAVASKATKTAKKTTKRATSKKSATTAKRPKKAVTKKATTRKAVAKKTAK